MKKIGLILSALLAIILAIMIIDQIQSSPEKVLDILKHWSLVWLKGAFIATILISVIFLINKKIANQRRMSLIGILCFTPGLPVLITLLFEYDEILIIVGGIAGLIIGYYSYIIDDHLEDIWEVRHVVIPVVIGLGFGGSVTMATWLENWQDEYIAVSDHSTCTKVTIKRYTYHYRSSKQGGSYYSWDVESTKYFFNKGESYPDPKENIDYTLETGALDYKDRAEFDHYKFIGGEKLSKRGDLKGFKWIFLTDNSFEYNLNTVYEVEENYFGHAIKNGKEKDIEYSNIKSVEHVLPTSSDVPDSGVMMFFDFFKIMAQNPDFGILRWIFAFMYLPFILLLLFIPESRVPIFIYIASSTIIILIILVIFAARSGISVRDYSSRFRFGGGGGFNGGGARSSW